MKTDNLNVVSRIECSRRFFDYCPVTPLSFTRACDAGKKFFCKIVFIIF